MFHFVLYLFSCSLGNIDRVACSSSAHCNSEFGTGYICSDSGLTEGYCVTAQPTDRCFHTTPTDAYDDLSNYVLLGTLYDPSYDLPTIKAMDLAIEQANSIDSLDDKKIALIHCNIQDDTTGAWDGLIGEEAVKASTSYLVDTLQITSIIGPSSSSNSTWAYDIAKTRPSLLISPSATSPTLSVIDGETKTEDSPGLFWRTVGSDEAQSKVLAHHINEQNRTSIWIVYQEGSYGEAFKNALRENLTNINDEISIESTSYATMNSGFSVATEISDKDAVVVLASDVDDITDFTELFYEQDDVLCPETSDEPSEEEDLDETEECFLPHIYLADGAANSEFLSYLQESTLSVEQIERISGSRPGVIRDSTAYENFIETYDAFDGKFFGDINETVTYANAKAIDQTYAPYAYDATWLMIYGYDWANMYENISNAQSVSRGLRRISNTEATTIYDITPSNWIAVRGILATSIDSQVNVAGASGNLDYNLETEELQSPIDIWNIDQSQLTYSFGLQYECRDCLEEEEGCSDELILCVTQ